MTTLPDPLEPLAEFTVGEWNCVIKQLVSGPLMWEATHQHHSPRAGRFPVGFNVDTAIEEVARLIMEPLPE